MNCKYRPTWQTCVTRCVFGAAVVVAALSLPAMGTAQEVTDQPPPAARVASSQIAQLNAAIDAYRRGRYSEAEDVLVRMEREAGDKVSLPCLYYLGLVYMAEGLERNDPADFEKARSYLQRVYEADRGVKPVELALELGVAQLASGDRLDAYQKARATLQAYVESEQGQEDWYGHFFYGIAAWRVGFYLEPEDEHGDLTKAAMLKSAAESFAAAQAKLTAVREMLPGGEDEYERNAVNIRYYQGLLQLAQRDYAEGKSTLEQVHDSAYASGRMRENARGLIEEAEGAIKVGGVQVETDDRVKLFDGTAFGPIVLEGRVEMEGGWDTNVILLGENTAQPRDIKESEAFYLGTTASLDLSRTFTRERDQVLWGESFLLGVGGETYDRWNCKITEYDLNTYSGRVYVNWEPFKDLFIGTQYDYSEILLGHDGFISSHRATPVLSKIWRDSSDERRGRTDLYYSYDHRNYHDELFDPRLNRDGDYHVVGLQQSFDIVQAKDMWASYYPDHGSRREGERWLSAFLGYTFINDSTAGDEFDMHSHGVNGGLEVPLPWRLLLDLRCRFDWEEYTQPSLYDYPGRERADFRQEYGVGLTYTIVERGEQSSLPPLEVKARVGADWIFNDSNTLDRLRQSVYEYDRGIFGFKLTVSF